MRKPLASFLLSRAFFYFSYYLLLRQVVDLLQYPMFVNFLVCFVMIFNVCKIVNYIQVMSL